MLQIKKILSLLLIALYVSYYVSANFFIHTHDSTWGTVTHSHLHTESHHNTKNGDHTEDSIMMIALISHFEYVDFHCDYLLTPSQCQLYENKIVEVTHWVTSIHLQNLSLRAPPIV
jgi:hypothetical protein